LLKYDCSPLEYVEMVILLLANVTLFYFVPISYSGETSRLLIYISTFSSDISSSLDTKLCSSDEVPYLGWLWPLFDAFFPRKSFDLYPTLDMLGILGERYDALGFWSY